MIMMRLAGRALALASLLASGAAFADAKVSADVNLSGGYASNPYGLGSSAGAATLTGEFAPSVTIAAPTGESRLFGRVAHTEYSRRYGGTTDYSVGATALRNLSELTSITGTAGYNSSIRNGLFPVLDPSIPINPNDPIAVDPTAGAGLAQRTEALNGALSLRTSLSARDSLSFAARGAHVRFPGSLAPNAYDSYGGSVSYSRSIGPATSIGVSFDVGHVNYVTLPSDSTQYSPSLTYSTRLAERVSLDLSAGVTISQFEQLVGRDSSTSFSGSLGLCYIGDVSRACLNASRRVSANSLSGTSTVTSFGANYSVSLSPRSSLSGNLAYAQARALAGVGGQDSDYGYGNVSYSRQILERLSAVVTVSYSDSSNSFVNPRPNFSGSVGVRYRLGEL